MENESSMIEINEGKHGTYKSYVVGFIWSIVLTLAAYFLVVEHIFTGWTLGLVIGALSIVQVVIQLLYFLHLGDEPKPYWNLIVFSFMVLVVVILVAGSLWIMYNLNYRMMPQM